MSIKSLLSKLFGAQTTFDRADTGGMPAFLRDYHAVPTPGHLAQKVVYFDPATFTNVHNAISDFLVAPIGKGNHIEALMNGVALKAHSYKTVNNAMGNDVFPKLMEYLTTTFPDAVITPNVSYENGDLQTFYINVTKEELQDGRRCTTFISHVYGATSANFMAMILPSHVDFAPHAAFFEQFKPPKEYVITTFDGKGTASVRLKKEQCVAPDAFYPFLFQDTPERKARFKSVDDLINQFYANRSSILLLTGVWGAGKSTLARSFMNHSEGDFIMVDNPVVYEDPDAFGKLVSLVRDKAANGQVTLFLDEMDAVITAEKVDNKSGTLARLLSLSSGIIELNLKIVITSNLMNTNKINEALTRGGRTFASLEFEQITPEEANIARAAIGKEPAVFTTMVTLASALNFDSQEEVKTTQRTRVGFVG